MTKILHHCDEARNTIHPEIGIELLNGTVDDGDPSKDQNSTLMGNHSSVFADANCVNWS